MTATYSSDVLGKYLISDDGTVPHGFTAHALAGKWSIALDESLELFEVRSDGATVGWLLGDPVDLEKRELVSGPVSIAGGPDSETQWQAVCARFAGSWLYIARQDGEIELRPDASATISVLFDPATRKIAPYARMLLGTDYEERLDHEARKANEVEGDGWFTGGLTAHRGIYRLLPNHALDTSRFEQSRFTTRMPDYTGDAASAVASIAQEMRIVVEAVSARRETAIALTGGNETRAILASLRGSCEDLRFVTLAVDDDPLDLYLARKLARFAGLDHLVLQPVETSADQRQLWLEYAGHAMAGQNTRFFATLEPLAGQVLIGGIGGEVGRGFLWPEALDAGAELSPRLLLSRLKLKATPENLAVVSDWFAKLPEGLDAFQVLDLAYLELRLGPWGFAQPRMKIVPRSIHPLLSYNQFERMWSLAPQLRRNDGMIGKLIAGEWPELGDIPLNRYGNWRDQRRIILRSISRPDRAIRKLRQLLGR